MCFPGGASEFEIDILPDGRVKVVTGAIGGPEHLAAEQFLAFLARELGGETKVEKRVRTAHVHTQQHEHEKTGH